ncbi:hypothetical protein EMCG_05593 [[Emmonsia] crescens]|uniref:Uncharacterized protein n=1 Tax=[Emmonsia] crescens TaxID=73230 RepID=A0A0G2IE27_9EURO|nr:hypothetical protein EMCG_05593 [Emmonsia crescens UAMH 3008]
MQNYKTAKIAFSHERTNASAGPWLSWAVNGVIGREPSRRQPFAPATGVEVKHRPTQSEAILQGNIPYHDLNPV